MTHIIHPQNVCSREMKVEVENGKIVSLEVLGGCHGNLQSIGALLKGMEVDEAIARLEGIVCRGSRNRATSCGDQLAKGLKSLKEAGNI